MMSIILTQTNNLGNKLLLVSVANGIKFHLIVDFEGNLKTFI